MPSTVSTSIRSFHSPFLQMRRFGGARSARWKPVSAKTTDSSAFGEAGEFVVVNVAGQHRPGGHLAPLAQEVAPGRAHLIFSAILAFSTFSKSAAFLPA